LGANTSQHPPSSNHRSPHATTRIRAHLRYDLHCLLIKAETLKVWSLDFLYSTYTRKFAYRQIFSELPYSCLLMNQYDIAGDGSPLNAIRGRVHIYIYINILFTPITVKSMSACSHLCRQFQQKQTLNYP
jgi:hypothetical protein